MLSRAWSHTSRGHAIDLCRPEARSVHLGEIVRALSQSCRYAGCTKDFYSTAEHSFHVAHYLESQDEGPDVVLAGLLHDAHEAYLGDLTNPVQQLLWGDGHPGADAARARYRRAQQRLDDIIAEKVGIDPRLFSCKAVKQADLRILLNERDAILGTGVPVAEGGAPAWAFEELGPLPGIRIRHWRPEEAAFEMSSFLRQFDVPDDALGELDV